MVGGDDLVPAISAASILAKTWRDALMVELDAPVPAASDWRATAATATAAHLAQLPGWLGPIAACIGGSFAPVELDQVSACR